MTITNRSTERDLLLDDLAFRHFWFPVARADALTEGPIQRHVLGVDLVIWSPAPGIVSAAYNRCPHRDARLSTGWLETCGLVCPYHGWAFGEDGAATRIPQIADGHAYPSKAALQTYAAAERYGWVWVALDEPHHPIPEIPEIDEMGWRVVHEPETDWGCTALHLIDNNIDPSHIAYVHRNSFGTPERPEIDIPEVERDAYGLAMRNEIAVESRPGEIGATVRRAKRRLHGPFLMLNRIQYPDGVVHLMVKACTPSSATTTHQLQMVVRSDSEAERPAEDIIAFDAQVWEEDRDVLENCWDDFHLELVDNVHLKTDRPSIEYRRWLADIIDGNWPESAPRDD